MIMNLHSDIGHLPSERTVCSPSPPLEERAGERRPVNAPTLNSIAVVRRSLFPAAFTLIELLVVISIVGLLAGLAVPVVNNFKPNVVAGATRQLLDDVARARQYAISQRTTVFMVFVPTNFWNDQYYSSSVTTPADKSKATNLLDKQWIAYNFV